jgi:ribosomal protein S27E
LNINYEKRESNFFCEIRIEITFAKQSFFSISSHDYKTMITAKIRSESYSWSNQWKTFVTFSDCKIMTLNNDFWRIHIWSKVKIWEISNFFFFANYENFIIRVVLLSINNFVARHSRYCAKNYENLRIKSRIKNVKRENETISFSHLAFVIRCLIVCSTYCDLVLIKSNRAQQNDFVEQQIDVRSERAISSFETSQVNDFQW